MTESKSAISTAVPVPADGSDARTHTQARLGATSRKGTPFFPRLSTLSTSPLLYDWAGLLAVSVFSSVEQELRSVRTAAAVLDMSPLFKFEVRGVDATRFIAALVTKDTSSLTSGRVIYTPWCNDDGALVNDGLVFCVQEDHYRISTGPSMLWFREVAERIGAAVEITDVSSEWAILSLQGPRSREVLERASGRDWGDLQFSRLSRVAIGGASVELSRQGFTGELGYELWVHATEACRMLDAILDAGVGFGLECAGNLAVDVARVEAGLALVGTEYSSAGPDFNPDGAPSGREATPYDLGMDYLVDMGKEVDFVGRQALQTLNSGGGTRRRLVGLELDWRAVSRLFEAEGRPAVVVAGVHWTPLEVLQGGSPIGEATSLTWSPSSGRLIALGLIARDNAELDDEVEVVWDRERVRGTVPARVVPLPFVKRRRSDS